LLTNCACFRRKGQDRMRLFFAMMLPAVWAIATVVSYFHPGDEYGLFVFSSIAGSWVCFIIRNISHLGDVLWGILVAGVAILGILGFAMDRFRVSRRVWGTLFALSFFLVLVISLLHYPSLDSAISKNGSITAYAAAACNIGLYVSIVLALIIRGLTVPGQRGLYGARTKSAE